MNRTLLAACVAAFSATSCFAQGTQSAQAPSAKLADCIAREQARNGSSKGIATTACVEQLEARAEPQADGAAPNATRTTPATPNSPQTATTPQTGTTTPNGASPQSATTSQPATPAPASSPAATPTSSQTQNPSPGPAMPATSAGGQTSGSAPASGSGR
jgi:hypothetical protein